MNFRTDHIALLVHDLDAEIAFLTGTLGLVEIPNPMGGAAIRWVEIGDGRRFHVQAGDVSRLYVPRHTHFALSTPAFDRVLERMTRDGVRFMDMQGTPGGINTRPDGMRAIFLQSPGGYWFEINDLAHDK